MIILPKKIMVFMPAYKTQSTICKVIERIPKKTMKRIKEIVVIDNNSPDQTYDVITQYKKKKNISKLKIFRNKKNLFFGGNIKAGFNYAIKHKMDIIAVLHSDGQYPSERIDELVNPIESGKAATVMGSRFLENPIKGGMPIWRYLGNIFLTKIENMLIGHSFSEWHSGYTAYSVESLRKMPFNQCENGYELTTDILLLYITNRFRIKEIPIPTHYGEESTSPSIKRTFLYFINSFRLAFIYFIHRIGIIRINKYRRRVK